MKVETPAEQLLFTTARVEYPVGSETKTGTAFFYAVSAGNDKSYVFLVTNRHVVEGAKTTTITLHTARNGAVQLGSPYQVTVSDPDKFWHFNPDPSVDVAVGLASLLISHMAEHGATAFYRTINEAVSLTPDKLGSLDAYEEVVFIGYPAPVWDTTNFLPVMRRGITATPVAIDYEGKKRFLIDAGVFPGSSGSPVFLFNKGAITDRQGGTSFGSRAIFLGVVAAVYQQPEFSRVVILPVPSADIPGVVTNRLVGLGVVYKWEAVVDTIRSWFQAHGMPYPTTNETHLTPATPPQPAPQLTTP